VILIQRAFQRWMTAGGAGSPISMKSMMMMPAQVAHDAAAARWSPGLEIGANMVPRGFDDHESAGVDVDGRHGLGLIDDKWPPDFSDTLGPSAFWISSYE